MRKKGHFCAHGIRHASDKIVKVRRGVNIFGLVKETDLGGIQFALHMYDKLLYTVQNEQRAYRQ